jgi:hypothetical protein
MRPRRRAPRLIPWRGALGLLLAVTFAPDARAAPNDAPPGAAPAAPPAPSPSVDIRWEAPPECPAEDEVKLYTERLLGQPLQTPRAQQISARAKVRRNEAGKWELSLTLTSGDRTSEETMVAVRCRALADATSLKVALATDPIAVVDAIVVTPEPPRESGTTAAPREVTAVVPSEVGQRFALRAQGGADLATFRSVAPALALFFAFERPSWRAELGGEALWGTRVRYSDLTTIGASLQLFAGVARLCALPRMGTISFPICSGFEVGAMRAEGFGLETSLAATSAWASFLVAPAVKVDTSQRVSLWVEAEGLAPVVRSAFTVRNLDNLYTAPPAGSRVWAGVELRLFP